MGDLPSMRTFLAIGLFFAAIPLGNATASQAVDPVGRSVLEMAPSLRTGEFVWAPEAAPDGPGLLIVNLATQRAVLFRNGAPIAATTVSTGRSGFETPTGVFSILEKRKEHYSRKYDNAPMPNMQRLTWKGIALHSGNLPGYPASHGCIRLPAKFSELLFDATKLGMTVVITSLPAALRGAQDPVLAGNGLASPTGLADAPFEWHPERARKGPTSIIVSAADQRAIVLRVGTEIGSAPVRISGAVNSGWAYVLRDWDEKGQHWLKLQFSGPGEGMSVPAEDRSRFEAPLAFRKAVADVIRPGTIVIVTPEPIRRGGGTDSATILENEPVEP